jgi:lysosomal acid phosphatase
LTAAGIEQQHRLGKYLRTRYGSILSSTYSPNEIYVRSTDFDRTLMSAQSNLIGLYPLSNVSNDTVPVQPIPIHTEAIKDDFLLAVNDCPRDEQLETEVYQSDEFKNLNIYYKPFFEKLQVWTNISNITLYNTWDIADTIFIEHIYNKAPAWADEGVRNNLSNISDLSFHFLYLNNDTKRIRGGPVIQDIWMNMNNSSRGQAYQKVRMYSAHDTTVSAVLSFLGINYPHQPAYASALLIDLYKQNSIYYVKVEYINVTDSNKPYPYVLNGCPAVQCPLDVFTSIYQPRFPASADVECTKKPPPTPPSDEGNKKLTVILILVGVVLGIGILVIFGCLYLRKTERHSPLLSAESYTAVA